MPSQPEFARLPSPGRGLTQGQEEGHLAQALFLVATHCPHVDGCHLAAASAKGSWGKEAPGSPLPPISRSEPSPTEPEDKTHHIPYLCFHLSLSIAAGARDKAVRPISFYNLTYKLWGMYRYFLSGQEWKSLSCVQLFVTPWTIACQTPLSMEFSRPKY